jgi:hypothetical protein
MTDALDRLIAETVDLRRELDGVTTDPTPARPPAMAESLERATRVHGRDLPRPYAEFLGRRDGWPDSPWGPDLFGTAELDGDAHARARRALHEATEGTDVPDKLRTATIIGVDTVDDLFVLLTRSGRTVELRYGEVKRHRDFTAYLTRKLADLRGQRDEVVRAHRRAATDWDPDHRAATEAALVDELRAGLTWSGDPEPAPPPPPDDPVPPAVEPADLGVRTGRDSGAALALHLVLYLGFYPTPDEVLRSYRAFRRHFPVAGRLQWARPQRYALEPHDVADPDDESWAAALRVDGSGLFGIRASVVTPARYTLNVCGVPPTDDGTPRASFCEVIVPPDEDPGRLARLARELAEILPVRSGHGGLSAYAAGDDEDVAYQEIFRWCRRFFGLDVVALDGWLGAATTRVVGAAWLTVLGPTFAEVLADRLEFVADDISVTPAGAGVMVTAAAAPTLGDVRRGGFPVAVAEVDRRLGPLRADGWHRTSTMFMSGDVWELTSSELPGAFADHHMTGAWHNRLLDPAGFLGPTPRQRGVRHLRALHAAHRGNELGEWRASVKDGTASFGELLRLISAAVMADPTSDLSVAALEFTTSFVADAPDEAFSNLMYAYLNRGQIEHGVRFLAAAGRRSKRNPYFAHNAACVLAKAGDHDRALRLVRRARKLKYEGFAQMRTDTDLRDLWDDPRFVALFPGR